MVNGDLKSVQSHLTRRKLALSKDENGHGLLHKVVYYGHRDIYDWMVKSYPETLETRDWVSANDTKRIFDLFDINGTL